VNSLRWLHPSYWATRVLVWTASSREVAGLPVTVTSRDGPILDSVFSKVASGLEILQNHHPRGYRRVRRHVRRVIVSFVPHARATWWGPPGVCMLSIEYFSQESATPIDMALSLLHEAMHGHLENLGFRYTPDRRLRLEAICTRAEIELAERLRDRGTRVAGLRRHLDHLGSLYSSANLQAGKIVALRELQVPAWLIRTLQWFNRSAI
jgi:hypothetical protein